MDELGCNTNLPQDWSGSAVDFHTVFTTLDI
jgi:hypothetical protein